MNVRIISSVDRMGISHECQKSKDNFRKKINCTHFNFAVSFAIGDLLKFHSSVGQKRKNCFFWEEICSSLFSTGGIKIALFETFS